MAKRKIIEANKPISIGNLGANTETPKKPAREQTLFFQSQLDIVILDDLKLRYGHWEDKDGKKKGGDKFDIREWPEDGTMLKGIRLSRTQLLALRDTLNLINFD